MLNLLPPLRGLSVLTLCVLIPFAACAPISEEAKKELKEPVNCATAKGDLRLLEHEKANVAEQIANGVTAIAPAGLVIGVVTGTEVDKLKVAAGHYNELIDKKVAEIKATCGL